MKAVKYTGPADVREVDAASFKQIHEKSKQKKVVWNGNGDVQEVNNKTADILVETHPDQFEIVEDVEVSEDPDGVDDDDDSVDDEVPGLGEGSPPAPGV
jgi:hypothetical protein